MSAHVYDFIAIQGQKRTVRRIVATGMSQAICAGIRMIPTSKHPLRITCKPAGRF